MRLPEASFILHRQQQLTNTRTACSNPAMLLSYDRYDDPLLAEDWDMILKGAKTRSYSSGDAILKQGESYQRIYQISQGRVRVERTVSGEVLLKNQLRIVQCYQTKLLGNMTAGDSFGEVSFIHGRRSPVSVIADLDTELFIIEGYFMNILFDLSKFHFQNGFTSNSSFQTFPSNSSRSGFERKILHVFMYSVSTEIGCERKEKSCNTPKLCQAIQMIFSQLNGTCNCLHGERLLGDVARRTPSTSASKMLTCGEFV